MLDWLEAIRVLEISDGTFFSDMATYRAYIKDSSLGRTQIANIGVKDMQ